MNPPLAESRDITAEALRLPERERAALAAELLASLHPSGVVDEDGAGFEAEVQRRAHRVRSGESAGLDWDDVLAELSST